MKYLLTILFFFILSSSFGRTYYFSSSTGNDNNSAALAQTQAGAWASINKMNLFMTSFVAGDTIALKRGDTFFGNIICTKSGTSAASIVFTAYGSGLKPIVTGLKAIPSWHSLGGNKWDSVISVAQSTIGILTINGVFQPVGRFPKANAATTSWASGGYFQYQSFSGATQITSNQIAAAPNFVGGEVVIRSNHYNLNRGIISAQTANTVTYATIAGGPIETNNNNNGFFFQNHPNAVTAQNDWSYTPGTKTVTFFSTTTPANVSVSVLQNNVTIQNGASFLSFNNITFQGANTSSFAIASANHIVIQDCNITLTGTNGVSTNGSNTITVQRDSLTYIKNNAIDGNFAPTWVINNNFFKHISDIAGSGLPGDNQNLGTSNILSPCAVNNNVFVDLGFNAIAFASATTSWTCNNNFIDSFCLTKDDGGGIYTFNNTGAGSKVIDHNIVLHGVGAPYGTATGFTGGGAQGIYMDNNTSNITITNNTIAECQEFGFLFNDESNDVIRTNLLYNNGVYNHAFFTTGSVVQVAQSDFSHFSGSTTRISNYRNNIMVAKATFQNAGSFVDNGGTTIPPWFTAANASDSNVWARPIADNTTLYNQQSAGTATRTLAQWKTFSNQDQHSAVSPKSIPDTTSNNIRFYYNSSLTLPQTFALPGTWIDMRNTSYAGSVTLQPMTGIVLLFSSAGGSPLSMTSSVAQNPVTCFGGTTTVTLTATGGTSPYQFRVGAGSFGASNVFTALAAGTYTFQVRDAASTVFSLNVTITQPTQISISQSSGSITINGGTTTTTVTASGGTGTLNYKLDAGSFQASNVFSGVAAGTHTITVRDANLCTNTLTYTLTQPSVLVVSAAATTNPLTCFGNTTTITVTASGATPPYTYSINGGSFQAANTFTNRGAGTYTLTAKDAAGATATTTVTITQPAQITITESHTAIVVNGGTSTVTITASGGTGTKNYSLDGGTFQASNVFSGVLAGNHTVTVRDANLCTNTLTFTITQPSTLAVSAVATTNPLACFGNTTTITVTATGGTTPYQYQINGGSFQAGNTFTNLSAGTYTLTVRDAALATATTTVTITQPTQISISESHTLIAINGGTSTVTITASGGTGTKNYSMDGGSFQASNSFSGILAGNHTVTVRDANLCTNTLTFSITQPTALVVSAAVTTAIACNGGTGSITVTASGGTTPYQYKVGAGSFQGSPVFSGLAAATYTFTVQDAGGAVVSTTLTISQPALITISLSFGSAPATVTVTAGGGAGGFTYQLDGGSFQGSNVFSGVAAGNHTVVVRDGNACTQSKAFTVGSALQINTGFTAITCNGGSSTVTVTATGGTQPYTGTGQFARTAGTWTFTVTDATSAVSQTTITITQPAPIAISVSTGTIVVNGGTTTVTVTASGGTGTLNYSLDGGSFQASNTFNNVAAGNHTVTVRDLNLCIQTQAFTITQPSSLAIGITVGTAIACNAGTTTVTVAGSGGTTPYTYGKNGTFQAGTLFSSIAAGTYTFSVKDAFSNQHDTIITITQPAALVLSVTTGTIAVNGGTTTVTATGSGGTGGLTYSLDGGSYQGSGSFAGVSAGTHTVTLKDANNCTTTNTFSISQPDALQIGITLGTAIACNAGTTSITVSGTSGTAPYTYGKNGTFQSGAVFSSLTAGTYTFSVKDAFNAEHDTIVTITQPSAIVVSVTTGTIVVNGGTTTVTATASGGTGGLQYKLDAGSYQGNGNFAGVSAGSHTVTVKDGNNCTQVNTFSISQPGAVNLTATPTLSSLLCYADVTTVTVVGSGGTTPFTYGKNGTFQGTGTFNSVSAGTYTFSVKDVFNAQHDTVITITQPGLITLTQVAIITAITTYGGTGTIVISSAGGTPVQDTLYRYSIDGGGYTLSDTAFAYLVTGITGGNHTVSIKDANNCIATYTFLVPQPPPPAQYRIRTKKRKHIYQNSQ